MNRIILNQARSFLYHRLMVQQESEGTFESFENYYKRFDPSIQSSITLSHLVLVLRDDGNTLRLLNEMSEKDKEVVPCTYEAFLYEGKENSTKFIFSQVSFVKLEKFLDHLSCFIALYLKEVLAMEPWDMILLSQASNPSQIFNTL